MRNKKICCLVLVMLMTIQIVMPTLGEVLAAVADSNVLVISDGVTIRKDTTLNEVITQYGQEPTLSTPSPIGGTINSFIKDDYTDYLYVETDANGQIIAAGVASDDFQTRYANRGDSYSTTISYMQGRNIDDWNNGSVGCLTYNPSAISSSLINTYKTNYINNYEYEKYVCQHGVILTNYFCQNGFNNADLLYFDDELYSSLAKLEDTTGINIETYCENNNKSNYMKIANYDTGYLSAYEALPNPFRFAQNTMNFVPTENKNLAYFRYKLNSTSSSDDARIWVSYMDRSILKSSTTVELTEDEEAKLEAAKALYAQALEEYNGNGVLTYIENPVYNNANLVAGSIYENKLRGSTTFLNMIRAAGGIPLVEYDAELCDIAQHKSVLVVYANNYAATAPTNPHYPPNYPEIPEGFYARAMQDMAGENLYSGNLITSIPNALNDGYGEPIQCGHRYNLLEPSWTKFGIGYVAGQSAHRFNGSQSHNLTAVCWPQVGITPMEAYTGGYWTCKIYNGYALTDNTTVEVKCLNNGYVYNFDPRVEDTFSHRCSMFKGSRLISFYDADIQGKDGYVYEITIKNVTDLNANENTNYTYRTVFKNVMGDSQTVTDPTQITISNENLNICLGERFVLNATVSGEGVTEVLTSYSSSNPEVASVDQYGVVKSLTEGTAVITVKTLSGAEATCNVVSINHSGRLDTIDAVVAICIQNGNNEYYKCPVCNKYYKDSMAQVETTPEDEVVDSSTADHLFTITEQNSQYHWYRCELCNTTSETEAHIPGEIVIQNEVDVTLEQQGYYDELKYCTVCNREIYRRRVFIPVLEPAGEENTYNRGSNVNMVFKFNLDIEPSDITSVKVDGTTVNSSKYTINNGTPDTISLKPAFMDTLSDGAHTITLVIDDVQVTSTMYIPHDDVSDKPWVSDGYLHWKECSCGARVDGDLHDIETIETMITEPTCSETGLKNIIKRCRVCGYEKSNDNAVIIKLEHTPAEAVIEEEVEPTHKVQGHYDEVVYCSVCNEEISRIGRIIPLIPHDNVDDKAWESDEDNHWKVCSCDERVEVAEHDIEVIETTIIEATCSKEGTKNVIERCTVCGYEKRNEDVEIEKLPHTPADVVIENETQSTHKIKGHYDEVVYCEDCNTELSRETKDYPLVPHDNLENEEWQNNEDYHWKECSCNEKLEVAEHDIETVETTIEAATCSKEGTKNVIERCKVCGYEKSNENVQIDKIPHTPADIVIENETQSTHKLYGHYDEVIYCEDCEAELSRETKNYPLVPHDDVENNEWIKDENNHWKECSCDERLEIAEHDFETIERVILEPTCSREGSKNIIDKCTVCGYEVIRSTVAIEMTPHTPADAVIENETQSTHKTYGHYDEVSYCVDCEEELSRETKNYPLVPHDDVSQKDWQNDEDNHWKECSCDEKLEIAEHDFETIERVTLEPTCSKEGIKATIDKCKICGYEETKTTTTLDMIPHTPADIVIENEVQSTHKTNGHYDEVVYCEVCNTELSRDTKDYPLVPHDDLEDKEWQKDENNHWKECSCEDIFEIAEHDFETIERVTLEPTCSREGEKATIDKCKVCGYEIVKSNVTLDKIDHTPAEPVRENVVAATHKAEGHYDEVVYCTGCDIEFSREPKIIPIEPHDDLKNKEWQNDENNHWKECSCKDKFEIAEHDIETIEETTLEPTCSKAGSKIVIERCKICGYEKSNTTIEIEMLPHTPTDAVEENRVEATHKADGHYDEVVYCSICNAEVSRENKIITIIPHDDLENKAWQKDENNHWKECSCEDRFEIEEHDIETLENTILEPTCSQEGSKRVIERCKVCGYEKSNAIVPIERIAHTPGQMVVENRVEATTTHEGHYDEVVRCSVCNAEISRVAKTIDKIVYEVIPSGSNRYNLESNKELIFKSNGNISNLLNVVVDNEVLNERYYSVTLSEGVTTIAIKPEYLDRLPIGEHEISIVYRDSDVSTKFNILEKIDPSKYLKGDMDLNGVINGTDASIVLDKYNKNNATAIDVLIGDMDENGVLNGTDASMILDMYNRGL